MTPRSSASFSALVRVRAVVPKPGMVMARMPLRSTASAGSNAVTVTSSARVESSPPETPIHHLGSPVWRSRFASPVAWMLNIFPAMLRALVGVGRDKGRAAQPGRIKPSSSSRSGALGEECEAQPPGSVPAAQPGKAAVLAAARSPAAARRYRTPPCWVSNWKRSVSASIAPFSAIMHVPGLDRVGG